MHTLHKPLLLLVFSVFLLYGPASGKTPVSRSADPVRIVYCDYRPFYFKGGNGDIRGIFVDFWELWSEKTGIPVAFSMTSWEESVQWLKEGRADINAGVFFTDKRDRFIDFSIPFFKIPAFIFHRPGIRPSPGTLNTYRVGGVNGEFSTHYLKTELNLDVIGYVSHELMITHALKGQVDAFIMETPVATSYLAKHNGLDRLVKSEQPVYSQVFRAGVKEGNIRLLDRVNQGLDRITPGEIQGILDNWTGSAASEPGARLPERVVIATSIDQQPFHFRDEQGRAVGMLVDLWRLWGEKNNIDIEFKSGTWSESLALVRDGKADIHAGCFYSRDREDFLAFAAPLTPCDTHFFFHRSVFGLKNLEDLIGFRIGVLENDFAAEFIRQHLPGAYISEYPSNQALFDAVEKGEIRVFAGDTPTALFFLARKGLRSQYRHHPARPLYTNTYFGAVRKGNTALVKAVKEGFSAIPAQEKAAVERQWTGQSHHKTEDVLIIACEKDFPPYSMLNSQGQPTGILIDFWRLWSGKTGRSVEFRVLDRDEAGNALVTDRADIHAGMVGQEDPSSMLAFSRPFYRIDARLFYRAGKTVGRLKDVGGHPVAVVRETATAEWAAGNLPDTVIRTFDTEEEMVLAAARGEVDFFAGPSMVIQAQLNRHSLTGGFRRLNRPLFSRNIHGAVSRARPDRLALVNSGLGAVSRGEIKQIEENWIPGRTGEAPPRISLSENERKWLDRHRTIRLGFPPEFPPFDFTGKAGEYMGITSEYVTLLNERLNLRIEMVPGLTWSQVLAGANDGKREIDMVSGAARTRSMTEFMLLTDPYTEFPWVIITRRDTPLIGSLRDLYKRPTAVLLDFAMHERLKLDHPLIPLIPAASVAEGLTAVSKGRADAYVGNLAAAGYAIQNENFPDLKIAATTSYGTEGISFAVRSDWPELVSIINKGLSTISRQERDRIRQRWFSVRFEHGIDRNDIWIIIAGTGGVFCLLILGGFFWNRHIHRARAAAEAANNAKSEFLASLSHEIRTPMNVIMGMTDLTLAGSLTTDQQENLKTSREAAGHLLELIDDILDLSKIEAGKVKVARINFSLDRLLNGIIRIYQTQADKKGLVLTLEKEENIPSRLKGDPVRLRQILVNLIGNAIKFTEKGEIRVIVRKNTDRPPDRNRFTFAVHDTGIGIPRDKRDIIFDSFTRVGRSAGQRGTGLGLAICKRFAGLMGGGIRVESKRGQGSSFYLDLPFLRADAPVNTRAGGMDDPLTARAGPQKSLAILLAEDSGPNAAVAASFLKQGGHEVTVARTGLQVLRLLSRIKVDLVFMDVEMPEIDGLEATRRIRSGKAGRRNKDIPIIALTAHALDEYREKCDDAGMNGFLTKPVDADTLKLAVDKVLKGPCGDEAPAQASPDTSSRTPELPRVRLDRDKALARCGDDPALLDEIWTIFAAEAPNIIRQMEKAAADEDFDTLRYAAHNLKSASDRIGAGNARETAARLEQMAGAETTTALRQTASELVRELTAVVSQLNDLTGASSRFEKESL
ncbi:MAG: transporter substrate-binding domain-containing protein [Desulfobacterales bacterium]|nr:transporter substrate-binding domain-containing protein [Desulfobacterales bacterium]